MSTQKPDQKPEAKEETAQEILARLERDYEEKKKAIADLKTQQARLQEQILTAQEDMFKSFQTWSVNKEQYLSNIVRALDQKLTQVQAAGSQSGQSGQKLPPIQEERIDNIGS